MKSFASAVPGYVYNAHPRTLEYVIDSTVQACFLCSSRKEADRMAHELPSVPPAADSAARDSSPGADLETRLRILVVEDDEDLAHLLAKVLVRRNYEVRTARDSQSALRIAREFTPDVALMDIGLPMMDGYELARELRKVLPPGTCRLIALTGLSEEGEKEKARAAGFEEHLLKPVNLATLRKAIER